jgi:hypothetical protein
LIYSYFDEFYKKIASIFITPQKFILWDNTSSEFFDALKWYEIDNVEELYVFSRIRWNIYKCQFYKVDNEVVVRNNNSIEYMYTIVYYQLSNSNFRTMNISKADIVKILKRFYDDIYEGVQYNKNKDIYPVCINELKKYTKVLIDNCEANVLEKTLIKQLNNIHYDYDATMDEELVAHYLSLIIYIYYLAEKEDLIDDSLKIGAQNLMNIISESVKEFLFNLSYNDLFKSTIVNKVKSNLEWWEYIPEDGKIMVLDSIIDSFLLLSVLHVEKNLSALKDIVESITKSNIFSFVYGYTGSNKNNINTKYREFVINVFRYNISDEELDNDLSKLENILFEIYKVNEIRNAEISVLNESKLREIEDALSFSLSTKIISSFLSFNNPTFKKKHKHNTFTFRINTFSNFMESTIEESTELAYDHFVSSIIKLLINSGKIAYKEVNFRDKSALITLFNLIDSNRINVDTIIGYRNWFYGYEKELDFKELENHVTKIKSKRLSDIVMCVNKARISFNSIQCNLNIKDFDVEEYINTLDVNENGYYLYRVTNDIYLPFEKSELIELLYNTRKTIQIDFSYNYFIGNENVGAAVIFKSLK